MAQAFLVQKSGGGINQTLPTQITAFVATADTTPSITLSWTNPTEYFGGVLIVKKIGSAPTSPTDGEKIYSGTAETFTDADVQFDTEYFYRAFAYNSKKQYQTLYTVASAKPVSGIALSELAEGALVSITENGVATLFYLLDHNYNSNLNGDGRVLFARTKSIGTSKWNSADNGAYSGSTIDTLQNGTYKAKFSEAVQTMMGTTKFKVTFPSSQTLSRSIFLLSLSETNTYNSIVALTKRDTGYQWLRDSKNGDDGYCAYAYLDSTSIQYPLVTATGKVQPNFTLPATAYVLPTPNADGSYTLIEEVA